MNRLARWLLFGVLAWQAAAAALALGRFVQGSCGRAIGAGLTADTEARVQSLLGPDTGLWRDLRARVPPGIVILSRLPTLADADKDKDAAQRQAATLHNLRHLLYPDPFLAHSVPDPIAQAEQFCRPGQEMWLLVSPVDPKPTASAAWTCMGAASDYELWRFRRV